MSSDQYIVEHYTSGVFCSYANTDHLSSLYLHMHNYYEMNLFIDGDISFFIDERKIIPKRGTLFLIDNTQIHGPKLLKSEKYHRAIVHFNPQLARSMSVANCDLLKCFSKSDVRSDDYITLDDTSIAKFCELTQKIEEIGNREDFLGKEVLKNAYLAELLVIANGEGVKNLQEPAINEEHSPIVREVMSYINVHLQEEISLDKIDHEMAMNKHYLNRVFKKETGITIYQYVILKKISLAKKLMVEGYSPKEVAVMLSYQEYSTFLRAFKQVTQITPTKYIQTQL